MITVLIFSRDKSLSCEGGIKIESVFLVLNRQKMNTSLEKVASDILYELWFSVAETIFKRVCYAAELDDEQIEALRSVALRPNDFQIRIEE